MVLGVVGLMSECFAAGSGGRTAVLNMDGQISVASALPCFMLRSGSVLGLTGEAIWPWDVLDVPVLVQSLLSFCHDSVGVKPSAELPPLPGASVGQRLFPIANASSSYGSGACERSSPWSPDLSLLLGNSWKGSWARLTLSHQQEACPRLPKWLQMGHFTSCKPSPSLGTAQ